MNKFETLSKTNQRLVILTSVFLLYGYLCRLLGIYFFWESKTLGWTLLIITVINLLRQRIKDKKSQAKKTLSENIAIGLVIFVLLVQSILFIVIPQTDAYKIAKEYLQTDKSVSNEIGEVASVFLVPTGGISIQSSSAGQTGQANLNFIVKGKTKFKDINIQVVKEVDSNWTIVNR
jgi:hypothetical protein